MKSKKKDVNWISVILVIIASAVILTLIVFTICDFIKKDNVTETVRNFTSIFTCITASLSLLVASTTRKENQIIRKSERKKDIAYAWYKNLVIDRHLNDIFKFFNQCIALIDIFEDIDSKRDAMAYSDYEQKIKSEIVHPFTVEYTKFQQGLISDITIIDDNLSIKTNKVLTDFQDGLLEKIQNRNADYSYIKSYINSVQHDLINNIKEYNFEIINF